MKLSLVVEFIFALRPEWEAFCDGILNYGC